MISFSDLLNWLLFIKCFLFVLTTTTQFDDVLLGSMTPNRSPFHQILVGSSSPKCSAQHPSRDEKVHNVKNVADISDSQNQPYQPTATSDTLLNSATGERISSENIVLPEALLEKGATLGEQLPIVTFDEWTKEKLKKEDRKKGGCILPNPVDNVVSGNADNSRSLTQGNSESLTRSALNVLRPEATQRNYASKECGAKVLFGNEEAENRNGILNEKEADDYLRNPCERAKEKWLIIELCETIQPTALEIANFELFSSGPRNIRLSGSERYPSNEWIVLGEFSAENNRNIQQFSVTARSYVKFAKLELITHYGNEHYCTLSLVRLLGISMVDEYEAEVDAAAATVPSSYTSNGNVEKKANVSILERTDSHVKETMIVESQDETKEINGTKSDMHLVDAMVNAVGSIGISSLKKALRSAFSSKKSEQRVGPERSKFKRWELCQICGTVNDVSYDFCYLFFHQKSITFKKFENVSLIQTSEKVMLQPLSVSNTEENYAQTFSSKRLKSSMPLFNARQRLFLSLVLRPNVCSVKKDSDIKVCGLIKNNTNDYRSSDIDTVSNVSSNPSQSTSVPTFDSLPPNVKNNGQMLPGGVLSAKESIFLKLNKRITALELNMSLSSEYLSELSRRYVVQTNESRRQAEKIVKYAEEAAINALKTVVESLRKQIEVLAVDLSELSKAVKDLPAHEAIADFNDKRAMMLKHDRLSNFADQSTSSLAHGCPVNFYGHEEHWTTKQVIIAVALGNTIMLVILFFILCLYLRQNLSNRVLIEQIVEERLRLSSIEPIQQSAIIPDDKKEVETIGHSELKDFPDTPCIPKGVNVEAFDKFDDASDDPKTHLLATLSEASISNSTESERIEPEAENSRRSSLSSTFSKEFAWITKRRRKAKKRDSSELTDQLK